jgi:hypothetical protein
MGYHDFSVDIYRRYAKNRGYIFYHNTRKPPPGHPLANRSSSWQKLWATEEILTDNGRAEGGGVERIDILFVLDTDSYIARPMDRLEPLVQQLGLLDGKVLAVATEWSCPSTRAGRLNGGIAVWRKSDLALVVLRYWISYWAHCQPLCRYGKDGFLTHTSKQTCTCRGVNGQWPHEQYSLTAFVHAKYASIMSTTLAGCPMGSVYGDLLVHLVGGNAGANGCALYTQSTQRRKLMRAAWECVRDRLDRGSTERCNLVPSRSCAQFNAGIGIQYFEPCLSRSRGGGGGGCNALNKRFDQRRCSSTDTRLDALVTTEDEERSIQAAGEGKTVKMGNLI